MEKIPFPDIMTSGFNFDEAITMAELCRRVYRVFENQQIKKVKELYDATYEDDEWEFIHSIRDYDTDGRALILKRKDKNQLAVVFRGTIMTSGGFELTGLQDNEDTRMAKYKLIAGEPTPPSRNVRVYAGMLKGFEVFKDELELFFGVLLGSRFEQKQLVDLLKTDQEERASRIYAIIYAICIKCNININNVRKINYKYVNGEDFIHIDIFANEMLEIEIGKEIEKLIIKHKIINFNQLFFDDGSGGGSRGAPTPTVQYNNHIFHDKSKKVELYVTGHSRGGALATFAVLYLKRYLESQGLDNSVSLKMYNVGSTKVGNKAFVDYYNQQMKGFSYRVQNLMDPAIYSPLPTSIPFPYNLQLMIPGIEYVREGDLYYAYYEHVGEAYTLVGPGNQKFDLDFGGPLKFTIPVPFPHGPDGYKDMLIEARGREGVSWYTLGNFLNLNFKGNKQAFIFLSKELEKVTKSIDEINDKIDQVEARLFPTDTASTTNNIPSSQSGTENEQQTPDEEEQQTADRAQPGFGGHIE